MAGLSPFEIKNELITLASTAHERMMLNAGRGNPNFLATMPRHAFNLIGEFALIEAERSYAYLHSGFGGIPEKQGLLGRFDNFSNDNKSKLGMVLLNSALSFAYDHLGIDKEAMLHEMVEAYLGCNYPNPPRMLTISEEIVKTYIGQVLFGTTTVSDNFDLFATEGGTASMTYCFQSLKKNGLLKEGDGVAMVTPIFSPYLEIPVLPEYDCEMLFIKASEKEKWQLPQSEIVKLKDKSIKLLCMVNPSNPPSVKLSDTCLERLSTFVNQERPDLMIVTDDVYATFSDNFKSIFVTNPYNTLCVYSFSKYFGCTGWRLGVSCLHKENVFDDKLQKLSKPEKNRLAQEYESLTKDAGSLSFINRLVADSRTVALNHTAGISTPQQLQMMLFALTNLVDEQGKYQQAAQRLIRRRYDILHRAIGIEPVYDENQVGYYSVVDLEKLSQQLYDDKFTQWMMEKLSGYEFIKRLARETGVVLLPGRGFEVEHPSVRISLANLPEYSYRQIGLAIKQILTEYFSQYNG